MTSLGEMMGYRSEVAINNLAIISESSNERKRKRHDLFIKVALPMYVDSVVKTV